jgi:hypothetical protein
LARQERSAKKLAQRIDVGYLKRPHWLRRWRFLLGVAAPALALVWVAALALFGRQTVYSGGSMAASHAVFANQCALCHTTTLGFFRRHTSDQKCLECHDAPAHQSNQTFTPQCSSCHIEHQGPVKLARVNDVACAQCHADLRVAGGAPRFVAAVTTFPSGHPEFAALRNKTADPGTIKFNHAAHLEKKVRAPKGMVQLVCNDCHRQAGSGAWAYGTAAMQALTPGPVERVHAENTAPSRQAGRVMAPPTYATTCAACHTLNFDSRIRAEVPHEKPEVVQAFVRGQLNEYLAKNPAAWRTPAAPARQLPTAPPATPARSREDWLVQQTTAAETLLWRKTCNECHTLTMKPNAAPLVAAAGITPVWMPHARFDHAAHRLVNCQSCHAALTSKETADVLLPRVATCQQCHRAGDAAENRCFQCHTYHDWSRQRAAPGRYSLDEVLGRKKTE